MKMTKVLMLFCSLFAGQIYAQMNFTTDFTLGVNRSEGSSNFSNIIFDNRQKSRFGVQLSVRTTHKLSSHFKLIPELGYQFLSFKKVEYATFSEQQRFSFLNFSTRLSYSIHPKLSVNIGPSLNILLNKPSPITTKPLQLNVLTGIQYFYFKRFSIGFDYSLSTSKYNQGNNVLVGFPGEPASFYLDYYTLYLTFPIK